MYTKRPALTKVNTRSSSTRSNTTVFIATTQSNCVAQHPPQYSLNNVVIATTQHDCVGTTPLIHSNYTDLTKADDTMESKVQRKKVHDEQWTPQQRHIPNKRFREQYYKVDQKKSIQRYHLIKADTPKPAPVAFNATDNMASNEDALTAKVRYQKIDVTLEEAATLQKEALAKSLDFPTKFPVRETIGTSDSLMRPRYQAQQHPAANILNSYSNNGVPVECRPNWSYDKVLTLLLRGPHCSAHTKDTIEQLQAETMEKVKEGYARVLTWGEVKNKLPPQLKLSSVAMIPHKSQNYRCILDLSFTLYQNGEKFPSVNDATIENAKQESMAQLGNVLKRLVAHLAAHYNPSNPFVFTKLDIKDGFWRIAVSNKQAWNFCYLLSLLTKNLNEDGIKIVVPNSL